MARTARDRVRKGRIALLENPHTSRAYHLDFLEDLDGVEDGLVYDTFFEYVVGDQCMLGQHDCESGEPFRGRTKWGTNSSRLKWTVGQYCDEQHSHQQVMGSNKYGPRSIQKSEWPVPMCRRLLRAIVLELQDRTAAIAYPAETFM